MRSSSSRDLDKDEVITTVIKALRQTKAKIGNNYVVTMTAWGPFTLGARLVGEETMMKATFKKPAFVEKVVDFATDILIHLYEPIVADKTLEVISLADPTASGDLISKKQFEKFAVPYLKKFTDWAKSKGVHTLVHICGNTTDRLDLFPLTGASCISLDHKTDIAKAKEALHGKMCFGGNVDPVKIMLNGTVQDVENACKDIIKTAGTDGGFVLMPGCDIPPTVPYENIQKFIQVAHEWKMDSHGSRKEVTRLRSRFTYEKEVSVQSMKEVIHGYFGRVEEIVFPGADSVRAKGGNKNG